ncbi:MAG: hypothetical protein IT560_00810 [Alphaproteobacteria bacterium]|nr:hypothetical protein [Alphaproteobacteria bacterium]
MVQLPNIPCLQQIENHDECIIQQVIEGINSVGQNEKKNYISSWATDVAYYGTTEQRKFFLNLADENLLAVSEFNVITPKLTLLLSIGNFEDALIEIKDLSRQKRSVISGYSPQESAVRYLGERGGINDAIMFFEKTKDLPTQKASLNVDNTVPAIIVVIEHLLLEGRLDEAIKISEARITGDTFKFKKENALEYIKKFEAFRNNPRQEAEAFFKRNKLFLEIFKNEQDGRTQNIRALEKIADMRPAEQLEKLKDFSTLMAKQLNYRAPELPDVFYASLMYEPQTVSTRKFILATFWDRCLNHSLDMLGVKTKKSELECLRLTLTPKIAKHYGYPEFFLAPLYAKELGVELPRGF